VFGDKHTFFRDKVQSRDVADYLKRVGRELSGRELRLVVETGTASASDHMAATPSARPVTLAAPASAPAGIPTATDAPKPAAKAPDGASRQARLAQALEQPAVKSILDLFGGEVVDFEPL
jgi:pyruvate/2-oxoglutarate dehydrogenase complex dihydrolipoamide acyltransferase (E2) component